MAEQFWVHLERDSDPTEVETKLATVRLGQRKAVNTRRDVLSVFASCAINQLLPARLPPRHLPAAIRPWLGGASGASGQ